MVFTPWGLNGSLDLITRTYKKILVSSQHSLETAVIQEVRLGQEFPFVPPNEWDCLNTILDVCPVAREDGTWDISVPKYENTYNSRMGSSHRLAATEALQ